MKFTKMHGIGNDYIYFNGFKETIDHPEELSRRLSPRHTAVGGDGIVIILPSDKADFRMRMFNADGSEGKMCGNATRCIGKYVYEKGMTDKTDLTLETLSGIKKLHLNVKNGKVDTVVVDMGKAIFSSADIPVKTELPEVIGQELPIAGGNEVITCVSMGNPHCVIFREDIDSLPLDTVGPLYENDPLFPDRVNTEFVKVVSPTLLHMRVWERGSGETQACGTGACATVAAAVRRGFCPYDTFVMVKLLGGDLRIRYGTDGEVLMEGGAAFAFEGEIAE